MGGVKKEGRMRLDCQGEARARRALNQEHEEESHSFMERTQTGGMGREEMKSSCWWAWRLAVLEEGGGLPAEERVRLLYRSRSASVVMPDESSSI